VACSVWHLSVIFVQQYRSAARSVGRVPAYSPFSRWRPDPRTIVGCDPVASERSASDAVRR